MNKIDKDFVYNRFPKTEHDIKLYEDYKAYQYINHPVLRHHLIEISEAVLNNKYSAYEIFGDYIIKFRSCILLFDSVSDIPVFRQIKNKYRWQ